MCEFSVNLFSHFCIGFWFYFIFMFLLYCAGVLSNNGHDYHEELNISFYTNVFGIFSVMLRLNEEKWYSIISDDVYYVNYFLQV